MAGPPRRIQLTTETTQTLTQTTGDQKTTRAWLNKYGQYNLNRYVLALLKYLANGCYWKTEKNFKIRRDFDVSLSTLAKNLYSSPTTAERSVQEAEEMGFITVIKNPTGGRNAYALHIDKAKNEYKPSKKVKQTQDQERREARNQRDRERRAAQQESDPYEELVAYAELR
jgi:DNA-binding MarR family transcriptional regulator